MLWKLLILIICDPTNFKILTLILINMSLANNTPKDIIIRTPVYFDNIWLVLILIAIINENILVRRKNIKRNDIVFVQK